MIYQGTNIPITIGFDELASNVQDMCVTLLDKRKNTLKHWNKSDIVFDGNYAICNISQEESQWFTVGRCELQIKFVYEDITKFAKVEDLISAYKDSCVLGGA